MSKRESLALNLEWRLTLFTALLLPLLVALGFWQLDRAEQKRELAAAWEERQAEAPVPLSALWDAELGELPYRAVSVQGHFDSQRYLLLDNRMRQRQFGYEVLGVFHLQASDRKVLVNRGWLAGDAARRALPEVRQPSGVLQLQGRLYVSPGEPYLLGEQDLLADWPLVLQGLEMDKLQAALQTRLGGELFPYTLRLDADDPAALLADWPLVNVSPAKHSGYALQWFSMALVLLLLFIFRSSNLWRVLRPQSKGEN
ncbi:SURF1 family protein [Parahaliea sp. F7430]|uniref:SURF1-like protein n=1 Tax=Sediminihaliea albiluteola TaxID=2758564 RepID=A0A7W2TXL1_9GAMM|nr:SURF1 family protein [Sediminihaliea albiluteola]MBA6413813.1 SURF1 family protein [Sediminihaliea albiluteola]